MSLKFTSILTSLLASSCCSIQLILNLLSFGCAGFAILDPYEKYFISISIILICIIIKKEGFTKRNLFTIMICLLLISSRYLLLNYIKNSEIPKNFTMSVSGIKCSGCAQKLCSKLKTISEYCSIDNLNPPIAEVSLSLPSNYTIEQLETFLLNIDFSYKILSSVFY